MKEININVTLTPENIEDLCNSLAKELAPELKDALVNKIIDGSNDELVPLAEATKILGVDTSTIYRWRKNGYIKAIKRGRKVFIRRSDIYNERKFNN